LVGFIGVVIQIRAGPSRASADDRKTAGPLMHISLNRGVLVATDGSTSAARAEGVAAAIAAGCKCRLMIVTVSRGLPDVELRRLARIEGDVGKARHTLIRNILEEAADRAKRAGATDVTTISEHGDPAAAILAIAERERVDLIVLGRRGVGALSELLFGSVSRSVVDLATCAVTVVP
jgi:nucleotide-binding universal stress UspA family protein